MYIIILFICFAGVSASAQDPVDDLLKAVQSNQGEAVKALLARGMDIDTADPSGNTLLIIASLEGHFDLAKYFLDHGARVRIRNGFGESPIMLASLRGHLEIVKLLQAYGGEMNHSGWTPLHYCAWGGHDDICRFLLEKGAKIDARSANGTTPIMMAARQGHLETVKMLLANSANANLKNEAGATALTWALKEGKEAVAELLRKSGAQ